MICVSPKAIHKGKRLIKIIIDHAHNIIGHFGQLKHLNTSGDISGGNPCHMT